MLFMFSCIVKILWKQKIKQIKKRWTLWTLESWHKSSIFFWIGFQDSEINFQQRFTDSKNKVNVNQMLKGHYLSF